MLWTQQFYVKCNLEYCSSKQNTA